MRQMYRRFYLESPNATYYLRGRGYSGEDFERVANRLKLFSSEESWWDSLGRAGEAQARRLADAELVGLVRRELRALLGITADPVDAVVTRWGGGLPQYAVGHVERVERWLERIDCKESDLACGPHLPIHEPSPHASIARSSAQREGG